MTLGSATSVSADESPRLLRGPPTSARVQAEYSAGAIPQPTHPDDWSESVTGVLQAKAAPPPIINSLPERVFHWPGQQHLSNDLQHQRDTAAAAAEGDGRGEAWVDVRSRGLEDEDGAFRFMSSSQVGPAGPTDEPTPPSGDNEAGEGDHVSNELQAPEESLHEKEVDNVQPGDSVDALVGSLELSPTHAVGEFEPLGEPEPLVQPIKEVVQSPQQLPGECPVLGLSAVSCCRQSRRWQEIGRAPLKLVVPTCP